MQIALASLIRDGLFTNQTIKSGSDTVDANEEQFTIIEKSDGEFDVQETQATMDCDDEVTFSFSQAKRGRGNISMIFSLQIFLQLFLNRMFSIHFFAMKFCYILTNL